MKTLYLHIGTPKTATTSIQVFLEANNALLKEQGFSYPRFPHKFKRVNIQRNGHFLVAKVRDKNGERLLEEEERLFRQGMDLVIQNFQTFDNVILSDENIWAKTSRHGKEKLWERLRSEGEEHDFSLKIIVYLRRQDSLTNSWWNQKVKSGKRGDDSTKCWDEFLEDMSANYQLDYYEELEKISTVIGKENVFVRRFGKQYLKNGSIYEDFLDAIGLELTDRYVITKEERNEGLYGSIVEIKRILNGLRGLSKEDNAFFRKIAVELSAEAPGKKNQTMFSAEEAEVFMETYREGNRKIMQEYLGMDGDMFDMDFSKNHKWVLSTEEMLQDLTRFTGEAIVRSRMENEELKQQIKATEQELKEQRALLEELKKGKKFRRF